MSELNVKNEYNKLEKVIVHSPGKELNCLKKEHPKKFLFKEKPNTDNLQLQHQMFLETLEQESIETVQIKKLLEKVSSKDNNTKKIIEKDDTGDAHSLVNLFYTRDLGAVLSNKIITCNLKENIRTGEEEIFKYIVKNLNQLKNNRLEINFSGFIEGGDILIPKHNCLMVGLSTRTSQKAIKKLAKKILHSNLHFQKILVFVLPKLKSCIHLDLIISQINVNTFLIDEEKMKLTNTYVIEKVGDTLTKRKVNGNIDNLLKQELNLEDINIIKTNNAKEQKKCGINVLTVETDKVIAYQENPNMNKKLKANGIDVIEIKGCELIKGRGGPRCMTLPLYRSSK